MLKTFFFWMENRFLSLKLSIPREFESNYHWRPCRSHGSRHEKGKTTFEPDFLNFALGEKTSFL